MEYHIKDINLADIGIKRIEWSGNFMKVLKMLSQEYKDKLNGIRISACLHVTAETANLIIALKESGASVRLCASNPLSTQDDIASALVKYYNVEVFAIRGEDNTTYYEHIYKCLEFKPHITLDDGADLTSYAHINNMTNGIVGGTEETTTGVIRLKSMQKENILRYPIIAVNDSRTKYLFDNRYGTGQSTIDGILRATNILIPGKVVVICGYGYCGKGIAMRAKGMGARVIITEIDPIRALEAFYDGYEVMPVNQAIKIADIVITATGNKNVVDKEDLLSAKDGVILANSGHFDVEINKKALYELSESYEQIRENVIQFNLKNNKRIFLLADGRLVNLVSAEGHPAEVMDMSFSNQYYSVIYILNNKLENKVYTLPYEVDMKIAELKLKSLGIQIDKLTKEQEEYLKSWREGT
ncbi:MAG: adenosylhomocysteinase [candidate division WOR-3 bacterium]|nr:adenosylhomocysteinase [candidate division WOR-3 bacterium]MDW8151239.1 adenosylhomocysteinase [candidate division WOR-3 bacterium]